MRRLLPLVLLCACGRSGPYEVASVSAPPDSGRPDAGPVDLCLGVSCPDHAQCRKGTCICDDGYEKTAAGTCVSIAASLDGLRWELPCVTPLSTAPEYVCISTVDAVTTTTLTGAPGTRYQVRLRLRGVVETKEYSGGTPLRPGGPVVRGGNPIDDAWNVYRLDISSPSQRYHLNQGPTGLYVCRAIDEELVVEADGRARFTLLASTVDGNRSEIRNRGEDGGALVVPGVPPAPAPYDGQFIQIDVVSVTAL